MVGNADTLSSTIASLSLHLGLDPAPLMDKIATSSLRERVLLRGWLDRSCRSVRILGRVEALEHGVNLPAYAIRFARSPTVVIVFAHRYRDGSGKTVEYVDAVPAAVLQKRAGKVTEDDLDLNHDVDGAEPHDVHVRRATPSLFDEDRRYYPEAL